MNKIVLVVLSAVLFIIVTGEDNLSNDITSEPTEGFGLEDETDAFNNDITSEPTEGFGLEDETDAFNNDITSEPTEGIGLEDETTGLTTGPQATTSSSGGFGEIGSFDKQRYPIITSYSKSRTVSVGDFVDFQCIATDAADHLPQWPKHDLSVDITFELDDRDLASPDHGWSSDISKSTKSRPSPQGRIDITEVAEVYMYKQAIEKSDQGWYRCRACIYKGDPELEACDISHAKFFLQVKKRRLPLNDDYLKVKGANTVVPVSSTSPSSVTEMPPQDRPRSSCQVFGDPHIISFDGTIYNMPSASCDYVLALDQAGGKWFIYGRMRPCGKISMGMCLESVSIYALGDAVELQRGWVVNNNGKKIETMQLTKPIQAGEFEVEFTGNSLIVSVLLGVEKSSTGTIKDWLIVSWDGLTAVTIEVPQTVRTQGLCGDNDHDPINDFDVWGTLNNNMVIFSESMKVDRNWRCEAAKPALTLDEVKRVCGAKKYRKAEEKCEKIFIINSFRECADDKQPYIDACIFDQCKGLNLQNNLYPWMIIPKVDKVLVPGCNAAEAYAMKCSKTTWDEDGNIIAPIDVSSWDSEAVACPTKSVKLENIPKLGCPQSFM